MDSPTNRPELLTRRELLERVSALLGGGALIGGAALLEGCAAQPQTPMTRERAAGGLFDAADVAFLDEVAETILPETGTPGAKAAGVGPFMAVMVTDAYVERDQQIFLDGMRALDDECRRLHDAGFMAASPAQRLDVLERLDREQFDYMRGRRPGEPAHYFRMMKELALLGYFTSEAGYTQAMRYRETPGRFDPCVPYAPGDRAWAPHA